MRRAYCDFESFYTRDYSLRKMTPAEYIMHPLFEVLGAAVAYDDEPGMWLEDERLAAWLKSTEDRPTIIFSHNALFDATIMAWRYRINPLLWGDTLSMSRGLLNGVLRRFSLASVSEHLKLGAKGGTVSNMIGYNKASLRANPALYAEAQSYAINDMDLCRKIERTLAPSFPLNEYLVIDNLIRCVTEPAFELDVPLTYEHLGNIQARKAQLLQAIELDTPVALMSNEKFAQKLIELGVEPPMKISKTTGKETYAFAKTDLAMEELEEHEDDRVQALVAARLGFKSTQEETRTQRFIAVAAACQNYMPVPLRYSGAHTHRFSGDWKLNMQNLGRNSPLRRALKAPAGYRVVAVDASQIEARLGAWLAGWTWLLDQFRDPSQDPYSNYATMLFNFTVTKANKLERFVGKQSILSLQYGASWSSFQRMCRVMGDTYLTEDEAKKYVSEYRRLARPVTDYWKRQAELITAMFEGNMMSQGPLFTRKEEIRLPSGLALKYPDLRYERVPSDKLPIPLGGHAGGGPHKFSGWRYGGDIGIFGGKLMENECQALARIIVTDAGTRIFKKYKVRYKLQVHDELVYVVPEADAEWFKDAVVAEMSVTPVWAQGLPLAAEGGVGLNYGECK